MPKITFDTNVLLSAVLSPAGASYALVRLAAEKRVSGYTSTALMEEFKEIVQRDYKATLERAEQLADSYLIFLKLVEPDVRISAVKDEDDNRVLECAVYAKADYIASWDPHLTELREFRGIKIFNPGKLLEVLRDAHGIS